MKKLILIAFSALLFFVSNNAPALADGVAFTYDSAFSTPDAPKVAATNYFPFRGTERIIFEVAGKTCNLVGSASPIGAFNGCNYTIKIAADGSLSGTGNSPCTQNVAANCK